MDIVNRVTHYAIGGANNDVCQRSPFGNSVMPIATFIAKATKRATA